MRESLCYTTYMDTKLCSCCQKELPVSEFWRDARLKCGYRSRCKSCDYAYSRDQRPHKTAVRLGPYRPKKERLTPTEYKREYFAEKRLNDPGYREYKSRKDREYRQSPKGKASHARQKAKRRAQELGGKLTGKQWEAILEAFGHACAYCGSTDNITVDHFVPLYLGGKTEHGNIVPSCSTCNNKKRHKHPENWCSPETYAHIVRVLRLMKRVQHT